MNIIVCVKQVPDVDDIKWTKENNLDRAQMLSKINMYDDWALDFAAKIKHQFNNVFITVVSMGPLQAKDIMVYALAKCADRAILFSDKKFAASDTLATSKILYRGIKKYIPDFDIIITGQMAQDGDTQQTPVSLAQLFDISDINNVVQVHSIDKKEYRNVLVSKKQDTKLDMIEGQLPCLLAVCERCDKCHKPKIDDYVRAQSTPIEIYSATDIEIDENDIGIKGSPTVVYKAFRPDNQKDTKEITDDCARSIFDILLRVK